MSMKTYSYNFYGFQLKPEEVERLIKNDYPDEDDRPDIYDYPGERGFELVTEFVGEAFNIDDKGYDVTAVDSFDDDSVYFIGLDCPSFYAGAYKDEAAVIEYVKSMIGDVFGDDFDYAERIRHFVGTVFG